MTVMPTLLLIDSSLLFRGMLKEIVRRRFPGVNIVEAGTPEDGLQKAICQRPQVIVTDLHLQGAICLSMIQKIASEQPEAHIAVLATMDEEEYRKAALEYGADYFISKSGPDSQNILAIIQKLLGR